MKETFKNIIRTDDNNYGLEIWNQNFSNEIIFKKEIVTGVIDSVNFFDCHFKKVDLPGNDCSRMSEATPHPYHVFTN